MGPKLKSSESHNFELKFWVLSLSSSNDKIIWQEMWGSILPLLGFASFTLFRVFWVWWINHKSVWYQKRGDILWMLKLYFCLVTTAYHQHILSRTHAWQTDSCISVYFWLFRIEPYSNNTICWILFSPNILQQKGFGKWPKICPWQLCVWVSLNIIYCIHLYGHYKLKGIKVQNKILD